MEWPLEEVAAALQIGLGAPVIVRRSRLRSGASGEVWGVGEVAYPVERVRPGGEGVLRDPAEITYDDLKGAFARRIVGNLERMRARGATDVEAAELGSGGSGRALCERREHSASAPGSPTRVARERAWTLLKQARLGALVLEMLSGLVVAAAIADSEPAIGLAVGAAAMLGRHPQSEWTMRPGSPPASGEHCAPLPSPAASTSHQGFEQRPRLCTGLDAVVA